MIYRLHVRLERPLRYLTPGKRAECFPALFEIWDILLSRRHIQGAGDVGREANGVILTVLSDRPRE